MKAPKIQSSEPRELLGGKYVQQLENQLQWLRQTHAHGNRVLFYDDLVTAYLLAFFNPTVNSLRTLGDLSRSPRAQQMGMTRLCRSTIADANALFDARLLEPIIDHLRSKIPDLKHRDGQLGKLLDQVQIVDGSLFKTAADVAFAIQKRTARGPLRPHVRLDLHLDGRLLPRHLVISGKEQGEAESASQQIDRDAIYILDRGYISFKYISVLLSKSADFVLRLKEEINFEVQEEQPLDEEDRAAAVVSDKLGMLTGSPHSWPNLPHQQLREVIVFDERNPEKPIRLITSLLDLPAHVIALLYRWRWQIELFFRWLKVHANFKHLISHNRNGMTLGFYVAVIAVLLMYLHTGRPMSKYAYNILALVASGWGSMEDMMPILEARERECQRDRERQAKRRAEKKSK